MDFTIALPDLGKIVDEQRAAAAVAITQGMRDTTDGLKAELRQQIVRAGMGTRLANTWRGDAYPQARNSLTPAGYVYSNAAAIIDAFSRGATIRPVNGSTYLWIPTDNVPAARRRIARRGKILRGGKMTPEEVENVFNDDLIVLPVKGGGLEAFIKVVRAKSGRGFRGRTKGRMAAGRKEELVLMFNLRRSVKLPKLISPEAAAQKWAAALPGLISRRWR